MDGTKMYNIKLILPKYTVRDRGWSGLTQGSGGENLQQADRKHLTHNPPMSIKVKVTWNLRWKYN
jgi:hypothetical protein